MVSDSHVRPFFTDDAATVHTFARPELVQLIVSG